MLDLVAVGPEGAALCSDITAGCAGCAGDWGAVVAADPVFEGRSRQDLLGLRRSAFYSYWRKARRRAAVARQARQGVRSGPAARMYRATRDFLTSYVLGWAWSYLKFRFGPRHPLALYGENERKFFPLVGAAEGIRIALAGDWATGTREAAAVARGIAAFRPHYSLHLGDVYYVGDDAEAAAYFLGERVAGEDTRPERWPAGAVASFSLLGNHEMYARGIGYFDKMLPALGQKASFFALRNEDWWVIGLDTGYHSVGWPVLEYFWPPDCRLPEACMAWLRELRAGAPEDRRGVILLGHHQPISTYDAQYPAAARQLATIFTKPVLWFWGHEHRLVLYKAQAMPGGMPAYGRCIGHGGMPVELPKPGARKTGIVPELWGSRTQEVIEGTRLGYNGFARLTLAGREVRVEYVDLEGELVCWEVFSAAADGGVTRERFSGALLGDCAGDS